MLRERNHALEWHQQSIEAQREVRRSCRTLGLRQPSKVRGVERIVGLLVDY